jgi:ribonuclease-3
VSPPAAEEPTRELAELEQNLGYRFRDRSLLETALRHSSYSHEHAVEPSNERLEFLGDAVIGIVTARLLYDAHPDWAEGELTRALHALVDRAALARLAQELDLGGFLRLGKTERSSEGAAKSSILADAAEAVMGAMYLDGGLAPVTRLARLRFAPALAPDAPAPRRDPKTHLQERVMALVGEFPTYELVADSGVEGDEQRFRVRVRVGNECWGEGIGRSKRRAEKEAARAALPHAEALSGSGE